MKCPYCDTEFETETLREFEKESLEEDAAPDWEDQEVERSEDELKGEDGIVSYLCESCGGEILGDESMAASPLSLLRQSGDYPKTDLRRAASGSGDPLSAG